MILKKCSALILLFITVQGRVISNQQKKDAFNPNELMEQYMNIRTDQGVFGSFHPNDLIKTIDNLFQEDGDQHEKNQWGLFVNNPTNAMEQYMDKPNLPGALGAIKEPTNEHGHTNVSNRNGQQYLNKQDLGQSQSFGFNPSQLNHNLMQSFQQDGVSNTHDSKQEWKNLGFDPDALNRQLMSDGKNIAGVSQFIGAGLPQTNSKFSAAKVVETPQARGPVNGGETTTRAATEQQHFVVFNPDRLNANLFNSQNYDANAINAILFGNTGGISSHTTDTKYEASNNINESNENNTNITNTGSTTKPSGSVINHVNINFNSNNNNNDMNDDKNSENNTHSQSKSISMNLIGHGGLNSNSNTGVSQTDNEDGNYITNQEFGNFNSDSNIGHLHSGNIGDTNDKEQFRVDGSGDQPFVADDKGFQNVVMGSESSRAQVKGLPSGVQSGSQLKQTETKMSSPDGIGGLGK